MVHEVICTVLVTNSWGFNVSWSSSAGPRIARSYSRPSLTIVFSLKWASKINRSNTKPGLLVCSTCSQWWLYGIMWQVNLFATIVLYIMTTNYDSIMMCFSLLVATYFVAETVHIILQSCSRSDSCWHLLINCSITHKNNVNNVNNTSPAPVVLMSRPGR